MLDLPPPPPPLAPPPSDPVNRPPAGSRSAAALAGVPLLLVAVVLDVWALFPNQGGAVGPMSASPGLVVQQLIVAAGLLVAAGLILTPSRRATVGGAAVAVGIVAASLGGVVTNTAEVAAVVRIGPGTMLAILAWLASALGALAAVTSREGRPWGRPGPLVKNRNLLLGLLTSLTALVLAVALLPSWQFVSYTSLAGDQASAAGNAFASSLPSWATFGDVLTAAAFLVVPIIGAAWRPGRIGALFNVGVLVVVLSLVISAMAGSMDPSAGMFNFTPAVAAEADLVGKVTVTGWFVIETLAGLALLILVVARWWTPEGGSLLEGYPIPLAEGRWPNPPAGPAQDWWSGPPPR